MEALMTSGKMMRVRVKAFGAVAVLASTAVLAAQAPAPAAPRATKPRAPGANVPRTADGKPSLEGIWDFRTITPMERPGNLGDKTVLDDREAAEFEVKNRRNQDTREKRSLGSVNGSQSNIDVERAYNDFWWDFGSNVVSTKRTSLVIDPPDGRIPALTPDAQRRLKERRALMERAAVGPEDRGVGERCILGFNAGPPMLPSAYNNNVQLVQTRDFVVIHNEMVHNARIVPLTVNARLPGPSAPQWNGQSRGRWEGDTLVVESKNFKGETAFQNSSEKLQLVERFTRVDKDTLIYEFTVTDPSTWTKPWTAQIPMRRSDDLIYEYACHEANYGMTNLLKGARYVEREGASSQK
jgi:hypothetical protein